MKRKTRKQRFWTEREIRRLKLLARRKLSAVRVARTLNRPVHSVKKKASRLGIGLGGGKRQWTAADVRRLKALAKKRKSLPYIAKSLQRSTFATERAASAYRVSLDFRK